MTKLFIVTTVPTTLNTILQGQAKFLSQYYNVSIITSPDKEFRDTVTKENVKGIPVRMIRGISLFNDIISLWKMIAILKKEKPDIIHSYTPKAGLISMLAGAISRVPIRIHTFTGLIFPATKGIKKLILIFADKLICQCATTVVPEGEGVKKDLLSYKITKKN